MAVTALGISGKLEGVVYLISFQPSLSVNPGLHNLTFQFHIDLSVGQPGVSCGGENRE